MGGISIKTIMELRSQIGYNIALTQAEVWTQGRIQDFKLGGTLKQIAPSGGRREKFWGISCEKSRFIAKKSYFFKFTNKKYVKHMGFNSPTFVQYARS
jgi:hypothetical protein